MTLVHVPTGAVVASSVDMALTRSDRRKGLLGRDSLESNAAMFIAPCIAIHTVGMEFPIDVAFCDRYGFVLHTSTLAPRRVSKVVGRSYFAIEAPAGAFERWDLHLGDVIEVRG